MRKDFKTGGRVGFDQGLKVKQIDPLAGRLTEAGHTGGAGKSLTKKGTKIRKEYAQYKKDFRLRTKIEKRRAGRKEEATVAAGTAKLQAKYPNFKGLAARSKYPKTFRRKGIT